jgi:hypothetical protein
MTESLSAQRWQREDRRRHDEQLDAFKHLGYIEAWTRFPSSVMVEPVGNAANSIMFASENDLHLYLSGLATGARGRHRELGFMEAQS